MNKKDLKKLSKSQLIKMLMEREEKKPEIIVVDDTKKTKKPKQQKKVYNHENLLDNDPFKDKVAHRESAKCTNPRDPKTGRFVRINPEIPKPPKQPTLPRLRDAKGRFISRQQSEPIVQQEPIQIRIKPPKPTRKPPPPPNNGFNFYDDIFQTENTSLGKFKIISVQSRENKKFKSYTNEFKVKILKKLDDVKEIYHIFQELVKTVKRICSDSSSKTKSFLTLFQQNSIRLKISN